MPKKHKKPLATKTIIQKVPESEKVPSAPKDPEKSEPKDTAIPRPKRWKTSPVHYHGARAKSFEQFSGSFRVQVIRKHNRMKAVKLRKNRN